MGALIEEVFRLLFHEINKPQKFNIVNTKEQLFIKPVVEYSLQGQRVPPKVAGRERRSTVGREVLPQAFPKDISEIS